MIKKKYINPEIEVVQLKQQGNILVTSLTDVLDTGLDTDDLEYGNGSDKEENIWDEAW
jgi:hypothetical protein